MGIENSFFLGIKKGAFPVVVITGVCRSGKTLLGNILATCKEAEYADEPYTCMMLPMIANSGKIDQEFVVRWMAANINELFNDLILLRAANFRPCDLSSIWSKKCPEDIFNRLTAINTRAEAAEYAKRNNSQLVVTLSESMPFVNFIMKAVPELKIIHVVRDPYRVAAEVVEKGWFSDEQIITPLNAQLYTEFRHLGTKWHLPWWVDDEEHDYFIRLSEYERGVYYWWSLMEKGLQAFEAAGCEEIMVRYEELIKRPQYVFEHIACSLGFTYGNLTNLKLQQVWCDTEVTGAKEIDSTLSKRINSILEILNG